MGGSFHRLHNSIVKRRSHRLLQLMHIGFITAPSCQITSHHVMSPFRHPCYILMIRHVTSHQRSLNTTVQFSSVQKERNEKRSSHECLCLAFLTLDIQARRVANTQVLKPIDRKGTVPVLRQEDFSKTTTPVILPQVEKWLVCVCVFV